MPTRPPGLPGTRVNTQIKKGQNKIAQINVRAREYRVVLYHTRRRPWTVLFGRWRRDKPLSLMLFFHILDLWTVHSNGHIPKNRLVDRRHVCCLCVMLFIIMAVSRVSRGVLGLTYHVVPGYLLRAGEAQNKMYRGTVSKYAFTESSTRGELWLG